MNFIMYLRNPEIQNSPMNVMIFGHFRHHDIH